MRLVRSAVVGAVVVMLGSPSSADAACSSSWVTFSEVAPSAERIVIGTVINAMPGERADDYAAVFSLTVEEVLRGPDAAVIDVNEAVNNPPCLALVWARDGDRIALASGGTALGSDDVTSIAYLAGVPYRPDIEVMSRDYVYAAAGVALPDAAMAPPRLRTTLIGWLLVGIAATFTFVRRWRPIRL